MELLDASLDELTASARAVREKASRSSINRPILFAASEMV